MKPQAVLPNALNPAQRQAILVVLLALLSTTFVVTRLIVPNAAKRVEFVNTILANQAEPHYQYRVFKPLVGRAIELAVSPVIRSPISQHILAYSVISLATFLALFYTFGQFLRQSFSPNATLIGLLLLQAVIPLSVTGFYMEGDFITAAFYSTGLLLMVLGRDVYLPLIIAVATTNREQMIFLVVIYGVWLISQRLISRRSLLILVSSAAAFALVWFALREVLGFRQTQFTPITNVVANSDVQNIAKLIAPIWIGEIGSFAVLCAIAFKRSDPFLKLGFLSLGLYAGLFFFGAYMWETGKFLPAFLIMIPMALQTLVGEFPAIPVREHSHRAHEPVLKHRNVG